ncbi:hypothetical protein ACO0QE_003217 [Hanseniaspora vineae]
MVFSRLGFKSLSSDKKSSGSSSKHSQKLNSNDLHNTKINNLKKKLKYDPKGPVELAISIESPPCVMYGTTSNSTGALLSGLLKVIIKPLPQPQGQDSHQQLQKQQHVHLTCVKMRLVQRLTYSKPFVPSDNDVLNNCHDCLTKEVELASWDIIKEKLLNKGTPTSGAENLATGNKEQTEAEQQQNGVPILPGEHSYPFSRLLSGRLPPSSKYGSNADSQLSYELVAQLQYFVPSSINKHVGKNNKKTIDLTLPIQISHSILRGHDKNSVRVFPPTDVTATCTLPNVVYPKSKFPLELRLEGVATENKRWRMRSLTWRLEEKIKIRQHSCDPHKKTLKNFENKIREDQKNGKICTNGNNGKQKNIGQRRPLKRNALTGPIVTTSVIDEGYEQILLGPVRSITNEEAGPNDNNQNGNENDNHNDNDTITNNIDETLQNAASGGNLSSPVPSSGLLNTHSSSFFNTLSSNNEDYNGTVHPNDYVLRQQLINQQRLLREQQIEQERKKDISLYTEEVRTIAHDTIKNGWKSDFENGGKIELITDIDCMHLNSGITNSKRNISSKNYMKNQHFLNFLKANKSNIACDVEDPVLGIYISHILVVEIVVAEEALQYANGAPLHPKSSASSSHSSQSKKASSSNPNVMFTREELHQHHPHHSNRQQDITPTHSSSSAKTNGGQSGRSNSNTSTNSSTSSNAYKPQLISVPTGAARVLRMQFRITFTERSGIGIPWDDEVPPTYQDIKYLSPPSYDVAMSPVMSNEITFNHPINNLNSVISASYLDSLNNRLESLTMRGSNVENDGNSTDDEDQDTITIRANEMNPPPLAHFNLNLNNVQSIDGNVVGANDMMLSPRNTNVLNRGNNISNVFNSTQ